MNYIVKISWYSGGCELLADEFFPTTIEKTRKLFKLLVADPGWDDGKVRELLDLFQGAQSPGSQKGGRGPKHGSGAYVGGRGH